MVKIRLTRAGRKGHPTYKIVVMNAREKRDSKFIEQLGHYAPQSKELVISKERAEYWLGVGAQPTDTVRNMLVRQGILKKADSQKKKFNVAPGKKSIERAAAKAEKKAAAESSKKEPAKSEVVEEVVETKENE